MTKKETIGPQKKAAEFYAGQKWHGDHERHGNGAPVGRRDKLARRVKRSVLEKATSNIDVKITKARRKKFRIGKLATNSHESKRYLEMDRAERDRDKKWAVDWYVMWSKIGQHYAQLTEFARKGVHVVK